MKLSKQNKQVVFLYGSTLLGVLMGYLSSIVNTHFLNPVEYGNVRYVVNIIHFVSALLLFGYFLSGSRLLALSHHEQYSRRIRACMCVILGIAVGVLLLTVVVCYFVHLNKPEVSNLFLVALPFCANALFLNYINTTAQGDNHIIRLSVARLLPGLFYVPTAYLIYSHSGATASKMILLQNGIPFFILLAVILSTKPLFAKLSPVFQSLNEENKSYGIQLYIGSLFMVASNYLAGIFLGIFNLDNQEVGFYSLALTVTSPLATLPAIIGTTYFKKFASQSKIPDKVMKFSILLTGGTCVLFILIIKPLVSLFYSESYSIVGTYASWLAVGYSIHGLGDMINRYLGSHGEGKAIRNSSIANGTFKIIGFTFIVYLFNTNGAIATIIICDIIYLLSLVYYYRNYVRGSLPKIL